MAKLTTAARKQIPERKFALPGGLFFVAGQATTIRAKAKKVLKGK
jgi:hypothetical protein